MIHDDLLEEIGMKLVCVSKKKWNTNPDCFELNHDNKEIIVNETKFNKFDEIWQKEVSPKIRGWFVEFMYYTIPESRGYVIKFVGMSGIVLNPGLRIDKSNFQRNAI